MKSEFAAHAAQERLSGYASDPAVPNFTAAIGPDTYAEWLKAIPRQATASLYLHVPYCRSLCWYCGYHTAVANHDEPIAVYEAALRCEIDLVSSAIDGRIKVDHIRFGGGTPTIMAPESFADLIGAIRQAFFVLPAAEIAVETDSRTLDAAMIGALALGGVNKASLGVQSFDRVVQRAINRVQNFDETAAATRSLRRAGIAGITFDLICGLPHQTIASCLDTVRRCVELRPDRFVVRGYAHVPAFKKHQRMIGEGWLPDRQERLDQSNAIANALTEAGYVRIGLDHFVLPGDAMAVALREESCGGTSWAIRRMPATSCSASAPAPSDSCRKAMCRTRFTPPPIRNRSPAAGWRRSGAAPRPTASSTSTTMRRRWRTIRPFSFAAPPALDAHPDGLPRLRSRTG